MALPATHTKFALDLKQRCGISDETAYISGTNYPDSRYVSGVERTKTHNDQILHDIAKADDFQKGWAVHLLCDHVQADVWKAQFTDLPEILAQSDNAWVHRTALKVIMDDEILHGIDMSQYLPYLAHVEARVGEDMSAVERYNHTIQQAYAADVSYIHDGYELFWNGLGLSDELRGKVHAKVDELKDDQKLRAVLRESYTLMLEAAAKKLTQLGI